MGDKVEIKDGATVRFSVGRAKTSFEAVVESRDGMFLVTKDAAGVVRKVRPGSCTVVP